jgi:hypothetical protein
MMSVWGYNELRLTDAVALRSEIGLAGSFFYSYTTWFGSISGFDAYSLTPGIAVEPRWYYDLARRHSAGKRTLYNSGNYFSLKTSLYSKELTIGNTHPVPTHMTIVPMWGLRRHFGTHFSVEAGAGVGYLHTFSKRRDECVIRGHLRIGYTF